MSLSPFQLPTNDPFVDKNGRLTKVAIDWLTSQSQAAAAAGRILGSGVDLADQSASIAATPIYSSAISTGTYRVNYYQRVMVPGGVSGSLTFTLAWTDGGVAQSYSGALMNGNTTTTWQDGVKVIHADANTPITYAVLYASAGAPAMTYRVNVVLEEIG